MNFRVFTLAERPELYEQIQDYYKFWPVFMTEDPIGDQYWHLLRERFPQFQTVLVDEDDRAWAKGNALPFTWDGTDDDLPDDGWDAVWLRCAAALEAGQPLNAISAIEINIHPEQRGAGLSRMMVEAMKDAARAGGYTALVAPVRPNLKASYPLTAMEDYVTWTHDDSGAPFDPWLRVHWRVGARIVKVAPRAMTIPGTVAQWQGWTGLRFPQSGAYVVPGALNPVTIDLAQDSGVYVEPNVWMRHGL